ncbi:hypothetical protein BC835DRAFT_1417175 [Cytidiella melzeri]|nr:hypothetical protein BC835DRAFT_1417175 [Cytidiella melzeri]
MSSLPGGQPSDFNARLDPSLRGHTGPIAQGSQALDLAQQEESHHGRLLLDVLNSLEEKQEVQKRRRQGEVVNKADVFDRAARLFVRTYHPFLSLSSCFRVGLACDFENTEDPTRLVVGNDAQVNAMALPDRRRYVNAFKALLESKKGIREALMGPEADARPGALNAVIIMMDKLSRAARSDDTGSLKKEGLKYIVMDLPQTAEALTVLKLTEKSQRGFNSVHTGKLLCPHRSSETFAADPEQTCLKVQAGSLSCTAKQLPAFLYDQPYNPDDRTDGLLRGPLCVRVYKHIFTGPSSASGSASVRQTRGPRRKCQAQLSGIERTTPRTIAYAVARHMLSEQSDWCKIDGQFDNEAFFNKIVALLEIDAGIDTSMRKWISDTLDWWDREVFNKGPRGEDETNANTLGDENDEEADDFQVLMAKRRRVDP